MGAHSAPHAGELRPGHAAALAGAGRSVGWNERVFPAEVAKAGEVAIGAAQREPMLDGNGCQVGVGSEVGPRLFTEERADDCEVPVGWERYPGLWQL